MNDISGNHNQGAPMGGHMVQGNQAVGIGVGVGGQAIIGQQGPMPGGPIQQAMINQNPGPPQGNPGQQQQQPAMMNPALNPGTGNGLQEEGLHQCIDSGFGTNFSAFDI